MNVANDLKETFLQLLLAHSYRLLMNAECQQHNNSANNADQRTSGLNGNPSQSLAAAAAAALAYQTHLQAQSQNRTAAEVAAAQAAAMAVAQQLSQVQAHAQSLNSAGSSHNMNLSGHGSGVQQSLLQQASHSASGSSHHSSRHSTSRDHQRHMSDLQDSKHEHVKDRDLLVTVGRNNEQNSSFSGHNGNGSPLSPMSSASVASESESMNEQASSSGPDMGSITPKRSSAMSLFAPDQRTAAGLNLAMRANGIGLGPIPGMEGVHHGNGEGIGMVGDYSSRMSSRPMDRSRRSRTFIDPMTEVPRLEAWFSQNTHPGRGEIDRITHELNSLPYRHKFPKLEAKNIQFWFKNRRAKHKRLTVPPTGGPSAGSSGMNVSNGDPSGNNGVNNLGLALGLMVAGGHRMEESLGMRPSHHSPSPRHLHSPLTPRGLRDMGSGNSGRDGHGCNERGGVASAAGSPPSASSPTTSSTSSSSVATVPNSMAFPSQSLKIEHLIDH